MENNEKEIKTFYPEWNKNYKRFGIQIIIIDILVIIFLLGFYIFLGILEPILFNIFDYRSLFVILFFVLVIGVDIYCLATVLIKFNVKFYYKLFKNKFNYLEPQGLKLIKPKEVCIYFDDISEITHNKVDIENFSFLIILKKKKKYPDIFIVDSIDDLNLIINTFKKYKKSIQ